MIIKIFIYIILFLIIGKCNALGQEQREHSLEDELQQESMAEKDEQLAEDDINLEELEYYRSHPLNMNAVNEDDLKVLPMLSSLHIEHFMHYRKLLGKLLSIYELQSMPKWDVVLIKKVLPYITVTDDKSLYVHIIGRLKGGNNSLLLRCSQVVEKAKGYQIVNNSLSHYTGSPYKLFVKYKYVYKNLLQYGIIAEKDAGEQFFTGKQRYGFDFYSMHFFLRKSGIVKSLAIGDYNVSLGQGLIIWQGMAAGKGAEIMMIKRQSPVLKPYHSAGEYNFHRGMGITLARNNWETTAFISKRKLDAVTSAVSGSRIITSVNTSGYHRTQNEMLHKNNVAQMVTGLNIKYSGVGWFSSLNMVNYNYSGVIQKKDNPYNYYAINGRSFTYAGIDYSYTLKNMHFFGEMTIMNARYIALLNGLLVSLDKRVEAALLFRNIDKGYVSVYGNAFTENTYPGNERGMYAGITIRPTGSVSISAYSDFFHFPWLKYRVDAPSYGKELLVHVNYKPDKKIDVYFHYRYKAKDGNEVGSSLIMNRVSAIPVQNLRVHSGIKISSSVTIRNRVEISWYKLHKEDAEQGFLLLADIIYKPMAASWSGNMRCVWFDTNGYNSRIYVYEHDVLYSSSVSALYNKGTRYVVNIRKEIPLKISRENKSLNIYFKWSQSVFNKPVIGSGLDEIQGKNKSEFKIQLNIL